MASCWFTDPPDPPSLSPSGHDKHLDDGLLGRFYILSPIPEVIVSSLIFTGQGEDGKGNLEMDDRCQKLLPAPVSPMSSGREFISTSIGTGGPRGWREVG